MEPQSILFIIPIVRHRRFSRCAVVPSLQQKIVSQCKWCFSRSYTFTNVSMYICMLPISPKSANPSCESCGSNNAIHNRNLRLSLYIATVKHRLLLRREVVCATDEDKQVFRVAEPTKRFFEQNMLWLTLKWAFRRQRLKSPHTILLLLEYSSGLRRNIFREISLWLIYCISQKDVGTTNILHYLYLIWTTASGISLNHFGMVSSVTDITCCLSAIPEVRLRAIFTFTSLL